MNHKILNHSNNPDRTKETQNMSLFTRTKSNAPATPAPANVPAELAEAYAAATPNTPMFMDAAASELAAERRRRQNPDFHGAIIITPEDRQRFYTDHLPELLARAEHLARLKAAKMDAFMAEKRAERQREIAEKYTCPICHEVSRDMRPYYTPDFAGGAESIDDHGPRMCPACRHTADLLHSQTTATPARQAAVRAALDAAALSA